MPEYKNAHLTQANREVIEDSLREGLSASKIAARINVSKSTITREIKTNRTCKQDLAAEYGLAGTAYWQFAYIDSSYYDIFAE